MWDDIKAKIRELSKLDKTKQVFGSRGHKYKFGKRLTFDQIKKWEERSGAILPPNLRAFYLECGDGGAGPYYGMKKLDDLGFYKPKSPFVDTTQLLELAKANSNDDEYYYKDDDHWDVAESDYQGLISIIDYGCGDEICSVTNGDKTGHVFLKTMDYGFYDQGSLQAEFHRWLDKELSLFETVIGLMDQCSSASELDEICVQRFKFYRARDYMVSYLGVTKPSSLFGRNENQYHGASQFPWYNEQFPRKKKKFWWF